MGKDNLSSIVKKAKNGNDKALNTLFTETYNDVYYFALKTVKDETLAADITQETFVTIFQNLNTLKDPVAYPAWSRHITYRHCLQYLKKQNREVVVDENEDGNTVFDTIEEDNAEFIPQENLDKEDFKRTILKIVDELPQEQRTAVLLYYYDELSIKEIAQIQGVTEGTVKSRLNYARKAIKASVETYEEKNNIKLHSVGVLPLLSWLFKADAGASLMPTATAKTITSSILTATGTKLYISTAAKAGSKIFGALWQKVVAGIVAASLATGGTVAFVTVVDKLPETFSQILAQSEAKTDGKHRWEGVGKIDLANGNKFTITTEEFDEEHIKGTLTVDRFDGTSYTRTFEGTGRSGDILYSGSIFYDTELNEQVEINSFFNRGYSSMDLRYDIETECLNFHFGTPYEAVLEKIY